MHLATVTMSLEVRPRQHGAKSGNFWRRRDSEEVGTAGYPNGGTAAAEDRASVKMVVFSFFFFVSFNSQFKNFSYCYC